MPTVNVDVMNKYLAEVSVCVSAGAIALLVIDGAGWHRSPKLIVPANIALLILPPYAPERKHPPSTAVLIAANWRGA